MGLWVEDVQAILGILDHNVGPQIYDTKAILGILDHNIGDPVTIEAPTGPTVD